MTIRVTSSQRKLEIEMHEKLLFLLAAAVAVTVAGCGDDGPTGLSESDLAGSYELVSENGDPVPSDPFAPNGCCITLSGSLVLTETTYDISATYENKNNGIVFDNSEQGTYALDGNTLTFTRTGGGGLEAPYLLAPGTVSDDGLTITLLYGDEGPGSNQIEGIFRREVF